MPDRLIPVPKTLETNPISGPAIPGDWGSSLNWTRSQLEKSPPPRDPVGLLTLASFASPMPEEAYRLEISPEGISIEATQPIGWFYGLQSLHQIIRLHPKHLPCLTIEDHPDFPNRGLMLDVSRCKVPSMETLLSTVDKLASFKINQLQLYTEHTFAYAGHETVWKDASPLTPGDLKVIDDYCHERFIELVPNQNCFGHMSRWLIHEPYRELAESPNGGPTDWGFRKEPQSLCPEDPQSIELVRDLISQLHPHLRSHQFNVGCDETIDLGYGRSKQAVQERGRGRVYLDFLKKIHDTCSEKGLRMQFWADIILKYPDLVPELPKNIVALNWGYEADHPFPAETLQLRQSGIPFYVCPGTSSWRSIGGRIANMEGNMTLAAREGLKNGACGFLTTDWGDLGHWQPYVVSWPGFVFGAALAWNVAGNQNLDLSSVLDTWVLDTEGWGTILLQLGDIHHECGIHLHNSSALFYLLQDPAMITHQHLQELSLPGLLRIHDTLGNLKEMALDLPPPKSDPLFGDEILWCLDMLRLATERGLALLGKSTNRCPEAYRERVKELQDEFHRLWHQRFRPGGFDESSQAFAKLHRIDLTDDAESP